MAKNQNYALPFILGKEFDCINKIISSLPTGGMIGDDCAVIKISGKNLLISVDTFTESVHFNFDYFSPKQLAKRCLEASLSDIAAMGGKALYLVLSISSPNGSLVNKLRLGFKDSLKQHGVLLIGGDTSYSQSLTLSCTVIGEASNPVYRTGAKASENVYITSHTGLSAAGMFALKNKIQGFKMLKEKHLGAKARLDVSEELSKLASSMIDTSDSLVSELYHIAHASSVSLVLEYIPIHPELKRLEKTYGLSAKDFALFGGEDFALLYTSSKQKKHSSSIKIGHVVEKKSKDPLVYIQDEAGNLKTLKPNGFKHF